jgi:SAM-dependent methyltransferase
MDVAGRIRAYWDADSRTYDRSSDHHAATAVERAAWSAALARLLPPPPSRVLDAGAGTGFLSLVAARLGHQVTALDLSAGMLERLETSAARQGLRVEVVEGDAASPPSGPYDAVIERHVLWTMPDPAGALATWREAAPTGRLVLVEGMWADGADPVEAVRARVRGAVSAWRGDQPHHHAPYDPEVLTRLPLGNGIPLGTLIEMVEAAGWGPPRLERLRDVEWARLLARSPLNRLLGVPPQYAISAD